MILQKPSVLIKVICLSLLLVVGTSYGKPAQHSSRFGSQADFVTRVYPYAKKAAAKIGVDPKLLVAQAAHESNWGRNMPKTRDGMSSHNLFGIKSFNKRNKSSRTTTSEYINNKKTKVSATFKTYDNFDQSFMDYANLISGTGRYALAVKNSHDSKKYLESIQQAGYASDPNYAKKIYATYQSPLIQNLR